MSLSEQAWIEEKQRLEQVVAQIRTQIALMEQKTGDRKEEMLTVRQQFWDDVTINLTTPDDVIETYASIQQQAHVLSDRERTYRQAHKQLKTLQKQLGSPYFGRIDFAENGEPAEERIYLGIASLLDENKLHFLIYDWRAPIASLYYDSLPGPVQFSSPGGTITGHMSLKRQYIVRDSGLAGMFDAGVTIGDELLKEVLGKHASTQMKSIVSTIQKEQNRIIRNERSKLLVVLGAAGSGKTSAALQRVAYLLYRYRESVQADQIVLFSPNALFNSYVSTVLPELGEENMHQTTFQEYICHRLGDEFTLEDAFAELELTLTAPDNAADKARMDSIGYKASNDFRLLLEQYAGSLGKERIVFADVKFRELTLISAERLYERFYAFDPAIRVPNRMQLLAEWILEELKDKEREQLDAEWVEEEMALLDKEQYVQAYRKLRQRNKQRYTENSFDDFEQERLALAQMIVREAFRTLRAEIKALKFIDCAAIYAQLFSNEAIVSRLPASGTLPPNWSDIAANTVQRLARGVLANEDAAPFVYLKELIEGFHTHNRIRYVFIDEVQDYSPFQLAMLRRMFPYSRFTVLGDMNQAIFSHSRTDSATGLDILYELFDREATETVKLQRTYRSTKPIMEFAARLLLPDDRDGIIPFDRSGPEPTVTEMEREEELAAQVAARAKQLADTGYRSIAVICKTAKESGQAYDRLKQLDGVYRIAGDTARFEPGIAVVPIYLAKGVEFDAVIVYNASSALYGQESDRKLLYTACTRAMHELHVYHLDDKSPFFP